METYTLGEPGLTLGLACRCTHSPEGQQQKSGTSAPGLASSYASGRCTRRVTCSQRALGCLLLDSAGSIPQCMWKVNSGWLTNSHQNRVLTQLEGRSHHIDGIVSCGLSTSSNLHANRAEQFLSHLETKRARDSRLSEACLL